MRVRLEAVDVLALDETLVVEDVRDSLGGAGGIGSTDRQYCI